MQIVKAVASFQCRYRLTSEGGNVGEISVSIVIGDKGGGIGRLFTFSLFTFFYRLR